MKPDILLTQYQIRVLRNLKESYSTSYTDIEDLPSDRNKTVELLYLCKLGLVKKSGTNIHDWKYNLLPPGQAVLEILDAEAAFEATSKAFQAESLGYAKKANSISEEANKISMEANKVATNAVKKARFANIIAVLSVAISILLAVLARFPTQ